MDPYLYEESRQRMMKLSRNFGIAALVCAIILPTLFFVVIGFACLSLLVAILAKGGAEKMAKNMRVGLIAGVIAVIISVSSFGSAVYKLKTDTGYRQDFIETCETLYGDAYREVYGIEIGEVINNMLGGVE